MKIAHPATRANSKDRQMGTAFWIRRSLVVFAGAFVIIAGAQLLKGHDADYALSEGLLWAVVTSAVFTAANIYRTRRGQHCATREDTSEMQRDNDKAAAAPIERSK
jgi:hypothetical protein